MLLPAAAAGHTCEEKEEEEEAGVRVEKKDVLQSGAVAEAP